MARPLSAAAASLESLGGRVLVTDFDGTLTGVDFFDVVLEHVPTDSMPDYWGDCVAGKLTHVAALNGIFSHAPRDPAVLAGWLPQTRLDPRFAAALDRLTSHGWGLLVVSAGCQWYIDAILAPWADRLTIVANPGGVGPNGLWMGWPPTDVPWYSAHFGVDKARIVQLLADSGRQVAFAGDGRPDLAAIRHVPADYRFAKSWLAEQLTAEGLAYHPFDAWSEITTMLTAETANRE